MKIFKKILIKAGWVTASLALFAGVLSMNSACMMFFHQPKVPQDMDKFKKH
ncbi:MAG: cyclic lactone autoinducer peptide [Eubacterium sp.]|jgi:cyclic lactone autoinducer peptide|nr:cyclic lactone autoinducer peptide [Eubacterium sp.]